MRTICEDIAVALNTVGTMSTLNRDAVEVLQLNKPGIR